ncbi:MAG TPA: phytoene/squalene synthase family protein [Polyangia bacterium]|nr:phytoene/squalene synthase family protein [Polyangia bacterium]
MTAGRPWQPPSQRPWQTLARRILRRHARSFAWAARLMPAGPRDDATVLYAWCRRCDDAVDHAADPETARAALARLRADLDAVCGAGPLSDPVLDGLRDVFRRHGIPRRYADELLDGMAMDLGPVRFARFADLEIYCYRVAGTVGVMMAHIMGVRGGPALQRAADLGIAMQLTNICRDVVEDEQRGRIYLPADLLGADPPSVARERTPVAVAVLLLIADRYYRSGEAGLGALSAGCAVAIRAARLIYAEIGGVLARRGFDVHRGRAVVSPWRKLWLAWRAVVATASERLAGRADGRLRGWS